MTKNLLFISRGFLFGTQKGKVFNEFKTQKKKWWKAAN